MTIRTAICCDRCDNVFTSDRREARGELTKRSHEAGWKSIGVNGVWENICDEHDSTA
ncbi:hypothetical protein [Microbacterium hydrocarbonoxydans]|uniref:hypothetical protein n=1 Tax=Microbacterium hydrocarbonoxydans TaxID=273678 RepID=UPI001364DB21|nr:hypothetical protein [Microbacterium hydrocarbonoxydans]